MRVLLHIHPTASTRIYLDSVLANVIHAVGPDAHHDHVLPGACTHAHMHKHNTQAHSHEHAYADTKMIFYMLMSNDNKVLDDRMVFLEMRSYSTYC